MIRAALFGAGAAMALLLSVVGPPRLIGLGCDAGPIQFAQEEDDFDGRCQRIGSLVPMWMEL